MSQQFTLPFAPVDACAPAEQQGNDGSEVLTPQQKAETTPEPIPAELPQLRAEGGCVSTPTAQLHFPAADIKVPAATPRKRRGKSMSRRRGQNGSIETTGRWIVVRFWIDVPGQEKRQHACVRICPKFGPGLLSKSQQRRRAKEIIATLKENRLWM